jgi:hypothetical protein
MLRTYRSEVLVQLACLACLAGCKSITLPKSDSTKPTISWSVVDHSAHTTVDFEGNGGPVTIKAESGVEVTCIAVDSDGGIHELKVEGKFVGDFRDGLDPGTGQYWFKNNSSEWLPTAHQTLNPQNNKVLTKVTILNDATPSHITSGNSPINEPFHAWLGTLTFTATATNYFNGVTTSTLELKIEP